MTSDKGYLDNISDPAVRLVVFELDASLATPCVCFMFNSMREGHIVNPPCKTIQLAETIVTGVVGI